MQYPKHDNIDFTARDPAPLVNEIFHQRWSPRDFEKTDIPEETLNAIFDAARWSPSCYNDQPWLFITNNGEKDFGTFLDLLVEGNQEWAQNASVLGFVIARNRFAHNDKANGLAPFDCGAAWMAMTMQARFFGLYTHGMGGIKRDEVYEALRVSRETHTVICGFALGKLRAYNDEHQMSTRNPLDTIWHKSAF